MFPLPTFITCQLENITLGDVTRGTSSLRYIRKVFNYVSSTLRACSNKDNKNSYAVRRERNSNKEKTIRCHLENMAKDPHLFVINQWRNYNRRAHFYNHPRLRVGSMEVTLEKKPVFLQLISIKMKLLVTIRFSLPANVLH